MRPVYHFITPEGVTTLTWSTLVVSGNGNDAVKAVYKLASDAGDVPGTTVTGTAAEITLGRLQYGANYVLTLLEDGGARRSATLNFTASKLLLIDVMSVWSWTCPV